MCKHLVSAQLTKYYTYISALRMPMPLGILDIDVCVRIDNNVY